MDFPSTIDPDKCIVFSGFNNNINIKILRFTLIQFGRIINISISSKIGIVQYSSILSIDKLFKHISTRNIVIGGCSLFFEKYNNVNIISNDYSIEAKRESIRNFLRIWKNKQEIPQKTLDNIKNEDNNINNNTSSASLLPKFLQSHDPFPNNKEIDNKIENKRPNKRKKRENTVYRDRAIYRKGISLKKKKEKHLNVMGLISSLANSNSNNSTITNKNWPIPNEKYPEIHDDIDEFEENNLGISSVLNTLEFNTSTKVKDTYSSNNVNFVDTVKKLAVETLSIAKSNDTNNTFENVSEDSIPINILGSIVSEKIEDIIKTALQCAHYSNKPGKIRKKSGSWDTVLAAATLIDTPPRIIRRSKYRILASNHKLMKNAKYPNFPWRNSVYNSLQLSDEAYLKPKFPPLRPTKDVLQFNSRIDDSDNNLGLINKNKSLDNNTKEKSNKKESNEIEERICTSESLESLENNKSSNDNKSLQDVSIVTILSDDSDDYMDED